MIVDLHWILNFLQQNSCLEENLPSDILDQAAMELQVDGWQLNESNSIFSTEPDTKFIQMANPYY